ncbi:hypothetical protein [Pontibacter flavimaris]|nr:hypothetical protein [Pontibacter flavimaris]
MKYDQSIKYGSVSQSGCKPNIIVGYELQARASGSMKYNSSIKV